MSLIDEDQVEQIAIDLFKGLGYDYLNGYDIAPDGDNPQRPYEFWLHGSNFWKLASRIQTSHPVKIKLAA